jgi:transcriptional regulator with AAA-type ATPase domain
LSSFSEETDRKSESASSSQTSSSLRGITVVTSERESDIVSLESMKNQIENLTKELERVKINASEKINKLEEQVTQLSISQLKPSLYNILLIGRTGKGKSTLANVLSDSEDFKESPYGGDQTLDFQTKAFS